MDLVPHIAARYLQIGIYQIVQSPVFIHRQIDPAGQYFGYKAAAAGTKDQEVQLL